MPLYPVQSPIKHAGERIMPGGEVELSEAEAARLPSGTLGQPLPGRDPAKPPPGGPKTRKGRDR